MKHSQAVQEQRRINLMRESAIRAFNAEKSASNLHLCNDIGLKIQTTDGARRVPFKDWKGLSFDFENYHDGVPIYDWENNSIIAKTILIVPKN